MNSFQVKPRSKSHMVSVIIVSPSENQSQHIKQHIQKTKSKAKGIFEAIWNSIEDFCANSDIGGLKYFADRNRHWSERIWWLFAVVLSLILCVYLMADLWNKRARHPITVIFDDKMTTIGSIPFPAITICPAARFSVDKLNLSNIIEKYHENWPNSIENATSDEISNLRGALHMCKIPLRSMFSFNENKINDGKTTFQRVKEIQLKRENIFRSCYWVGIKMNCSMFKYVMTERGTCFSFNMLNSNRIFTNITTSEILTINSNPDANDWNMEKELQLILKPYEQRKAFAQPDYPYHVRTLDDIDSLNLELYSNPDDWYWNYHCESPVTRSFKVFLHRPDAIKDAFDRPFEVEVGKKVIVSITPNVILTPGYLQTYDINHRRCIFNSERQLKFFKVYTKSNCEHECLANFTKIECGCVKFSMPREPDTQVCDVLNLTCYSRAMRKLRGMRDINDTYASDFRQGCNCYATCEDIQYVPESTDLFVQSQSLHEDKESRTVLSLSFKSRKFLSLKRAETFTVSNRLAACGGLLGLFMGISLLSFIEMIVFCALRFANKFTARRKQHLIQKRYAFRRNYVNVLPPVE